MARGPLPVDVSQTLACLRAHESDTAGGYGAVNPNGHYGAYQASQETWNGVWSRHGRPDLVGVRPDYASPEDQDEFAVLLFGERGAQPWNGSGC